MATILCRARRNTRCCFREQASPYGLMPPCISCLERQIMLSLTLQSQSFVFSGSFLSPHGLQGIHPYPGSPLVAMITWRFPLLSPSLPSSQLYCETDPLLQHMFSTTWDASKALLSHLLRLTMNSVSPPTSPGCCTCWKWFEWPLSVLILSEHTCVFVHIHNSSITVCVQQHHTCESGGNRSQRAHGSEEGSEVRVCGRRLPRRISVTENWLTWAAGAQTASRQSFQRAALGGHTGLPTLDVAMPLYLLVSLVCREESLHLVCSVQTATGWTCRGGHPGFVMETDIAHWSRGRCLWSKLAQNSWKGLARTSPAMEEMTFTLPTWPGLWAVHVPRRWTMNDQGSQALQKALFFMMPFIILIHYLFKL